MSGKLAPLHISDPPSIPPPQHSHKAWQATKTDRVILTTEEPRRSGRATKGQTSKNQDETAPGPKSKKGSKAKAAKKEPDEEEEDEDTIVRCICGQYDPEDEGTMICCDNCSAWQHNICMGLPEDEDLCPEHYFCEQCRPGDHKALLEATRRGERPEQVAAKRIEEAEAAAAEAERERKQKKGKKGKGGRQSKAAESQDVDSDRVASPAVSESTKRKFQEDTVKDEVCATS